MSDIKSRTIRTVKKNYEDNPLLAFALIGHKTHKNKDLILKKDTPIYGIYQDKSPSIAIMKSTQVGISEYMIIRAIRRASDGKNVLYVLPTYSLKNVFVQDRVDKSILFTPHYQIMLGHHGNKLAESTSIKQIATGSINFVGSNTPVSFISYPADDILLDELDQCESEYLPMLEERQSASTDKSTVKVSNPTINNFGIDLEYQKSDKKVWKITHSCGHEFTPDFYKNVVRQVEDNNYMVIDPDYEYGAEPCPICEKCNKPFNRFMPGKWVKTAERDISGYHISKMFSTTVTLKEMLQRFTDGLSNDNIMQRFYNGDLGLPYSSVGSKISELYLDECISDYTMPDSCTGRCVMGADVGNDIHVQINELLPDGRRRVVYIGKVRDEEEVADLYKRYNCIVGVIDAMPETRLSKRLCSRFRGMFMCRYIHGIKDNIDPRNKILSVDRTQAIDAVKEMFMTGGILLPANARSLPEYYSHITSSTRVLNEKTGEYSWIETGPDHLLHAGAYCLKSEKILKMI